MNIVGEVKVDVGCGNAFGGKNEEEDGEEGKEEGGAPQAKVVDIIDTFRYEETVFNKEQFK
jgi:hypothetical protein